MSKLILLAGDLLIDSNCGIALMGNEELVEEFFADRKGYIPAIVVGELLYGAYNSGRPERNLANLRKFLAPIPVFPCDATTADYYARTRLQLKQIGRPIPENDIWIAATAMQYGLLLATKDHHFSYIEGLECVSW